jgi:Mn-dependent DtxR family transcriptional regulator
MLETSENTIVYNAKLGRRSKYNLAKNYLLEKYCNDEEVTISQLARDLRVGYSTARNYLLRFLDEELNVVNVAKYYNYKR